jgi:Flp pilus assembly pilin Flp
VNHRKPHSRTSIAFVRETVAQDLVEYALLVAFIAFTAVAAAPLIQTAIGTAYAIYNTSTQDLWQPPDPATP